MLVWLVNIIARNNLQQYIKEVLVMQFITNIYNICVRIEIDVLD